MFDVVVSPAFCSSLWADRYGGEELGTRVAQVQEDCPAMLCLWLKSNWKLMNDKEYCFEEEMPHSQASYYFSG